MNSYRIKKILNNYFYQRQAKDELSILKEKINCQLKSQRLR